MRAVGYVSLEGIRVEMMGGGGRWGGRGRWEGKVEGGSPR